MSMTYATPSDSYPPRYVSRHRRTFLFLESTIMFRDKNSHLRLAGRPADYQKLGIDPVEVAQFEDGQRIGTEKARYQRRHFDTHRHDATTAPVPSSTNPHVNPNPPIPHPRQT